PSSARIIIRPGAAEIDDGLPAGVLSLSFHINRGANSAQDRRIGNCCHSQWIVHRWAGVVALFHVGSSKEFHELCDKLRNIGANVLELFHALRYREYLVGDIESDHGYWPGFFKDNRCGFWVSQDIELSSRSHIAGVVPAPIKVIPPTRSTSCGYMRAKSAILVKEPVGIMTTAPGSFSEITW